MRVFLSPLFTYFLFPSLQFPWFFVPWRYSRGAQWLDTAIMQPTYLSSTTSYLESLGDKGAESRLCRFNNPCYKFHHVPGQRLLSHFLPPFLTTQLPTTRQAWVSKVFAGFSSLSSVVVITTTAAVLHHTKGHWQQTISYTRRTLALELMVTTLRPRGAPDKQAAAYIHSCCWRGAAVALSYTLVEAVNTLQILFSRHKWHFGPRLIGYAETRITKTRNAVTSNADISTGRTLTFVCQVELYINWFSIPAIYIQRSITKNNTYTTNKMPFHTPVDAITTQQHLACFPY